MTSVTPIPATRLLKTEPHEASRSRSRKLGAASHGNAQLPAAASEPRFRGTLRNIEPYNLSSIVSPDDHYVEQSKRGRHGDKHVDGGDTMPSLRRKLRHVGEGLPTPRATYFRPCGTRWLSGSLGKPYSRYPSSSDAVFSDRAPLE
jgi:hypothetical protein